MKLIELILSIALVVCMGFLAFFSYHGESKIQEVPVQAQEVFKSSSKFIGKLGDRCDIYEVKTNGHLVLVTICYGSTTPHSQKVY